MFSGWLDANIMRYIAYKYDITSVNTLINTSSESEGHVCSFLSGSQPETESISAQSDRRTRCVPCVCILRIIPGGCVHTTCSSRVHVMERKLMLNISRDQNESTHGSEMGKGEKWVAYATEY